MKYKKIMKLITLSALLLVSVSYLAAVSDGFRVISEGDNFTEIEFVLPEYKIYEEAYQGTNYIRFYSPDQGLLMFEGLPELLSYSFLLSVPKTGTVEVESLEVLEKYTESDVDVFPSQGFGAESAEKKAFIKDEDFYRQDTSYPDERFQVSSPAIMRNMRLVSVNVNPMTYNPAERELTVAQKIRMKITYDREADSSNELLNPRRRESRTFEQIQRGAVLNYDQFRNHGTRNNYQERSMIIVHRQTDNLQYMNALNSFANWKRDKGFEVTVIHTGDYGTNAAIRNFIRNAYHNWDNPPEYVIMIGDLNSNSSVPMWIDPQQDAYQGGNAYTDHNYSLMDGDDHLSDVVVGRISIRSAIQLATFWSKVRSYEKHPYMEETDWYEHNLLVGEANMIGVSALYTTRYLNDVITRYNSDINNTQITQPPYPTPIQNALNNGATFCAIRCWYSIGGWTPTDNDYNNLHKLPHLVVLTCNSMDFTAPGGIRLGDQFRIGSPNEPKGPISALGMSWVTDTAFNNYMTGAIFRGLFDLDMWTMGDAKVYSKLEHYRAFWNSHQWRARHYLYMLNMKGDPSLDVWKGIPQQMNADYPETLPPGSNGIVITITDEDDQPIKDAWVTIRKAESLENEQIFATGYTDTAGRIVHYFDNDVEGEVRVTATKRGFIPHNGNFEITGNAGVTYHSFLTNDDLVAGREINFLLTVRNHHNQAVNEVNGTISLDSEYIDIEIEENQAAFGNIGANSNAESQEQFTIDVSPDTPEGYKANFRLSVTDNAQNNWTSYFEVVINNGKLEIVEIVVNDNDDGVLDPLEEASLNIRIRNAGNVALDNIEGTISGGGYGLEIVEDEAFYGNIAVNETVGSRDRHIEVSTSSFVMPGMSFDLQLHLHNEDGFSQYLPLKLPIGTVTVDDPLGPCPYGYWIFDCGDENYMEAPEYDWIEIAQGNGGPGTDTNISSDYNNNQGNHTMNLPFPFRFYGEDYEEITISANGWITFIETEMSTQRNWRLPGALGPDPIIAAFWDNLGVSANSGVYTWYNEEESFFVIQWENAINVNLNAPETFQIILYDPEYHFTSTLDGMIKIQYRVFNNVNNRGGQPGGGQSQFGEWGNYSTIGIADHTGLRGLEYTFNNEYPTAARELDDETAILITTGSLGFTPYVAIDDVRWVDDDNNVPGYGDDGAFNMRLLNMGGEDAFDVRAVLSTNDEYITIVEDEAQYGDIASEQAVNQNNAFTLQIADNVPDKHRAFFNLSIHAEGELNWNFRFHIDIAAPKINTRTPFVYDPEPGGNNNGLVDAGEELIVYLPVFNDGGAGSPEVNFTVTTDNDLVEIVDISEQIFPTIGSDIGMYPGIKLRISEEAEEGTGLLFDYLFESGEYEFTGSFVLGVGGILPTQLGSGEAVTSTSDASPINIYFQTLRGQAVYTAEELWEAGISAGGTVTELGFWVAMAPEYGLPNFLIRMRHTDAEDASEHIDGPYTTVYTNEMYNPTAERWDLLELEHPFQWNGVDNILVDTAFAPVESWSNSGTVRYYEVENGYRYARHDSPDQTDIETRDVSSKKPQVKMIIDTSAGDTSDRPENLTAEIFDLSRIDLSWTAPDNQEDLIGFNLYRNGKIVNEDPIAETDFIDTEFDTVSVCYYYVTTVYEERETLPSNIVSVRFEKAPAPKLSHKPGNYYEPIKIKLDIDDEKAYIYYTLDGSEPNRDSYLYEEEIEINSHTLLKTRSFIDGLLPGEIAKAQYNILYPATDLKADGALDNLKLSWRPPDYPAESRAANISRTRLSPGRDESGLSSSRSSRTRRTADRTDNHHQFLREGVLGYNVYRSHEDGEFEQINEETVADTTYIDSAPEEANYRYYITVVYEVGESQASNIIDVGPLSVDDEDQHNLPLTTGLQKAYPNPFNPETLIGFTLHKQSKVSITIYDVTGRKVNELLNETVEPGRHSIVWQGDNQNGRRMSSGIYFYRMTASGFSDTKKVLMLK